MCLVGKLFKYLDFVFFLWILLYFKEGVEIFYMFNMFFRKFLLGVDFFCKIFLKLDVVK